VDNLFVVDHFIKRYLKFKREKSVTATYIYIYIYIDVQVGEGKANADNVLLHQAFCLLFSSYVFRSP
jgi:hypothetical protein